MTLWAELQRGIRRHPDARGFELVTVAAARVARETSSVNAEHVGALKANGNGALPQDLKQEFTVGRPIDSV